MVSKGGSAFGQAGNSKRASSWQQFEGSQEAASRKQPESGQAAAKAENTGAVKEQIKGDSFSLRPARGAAREQSLGIRHGAVRFYGSTQVSTRSSRENKCQGGTQGSA